jgi:AcrR family transcriptional regulator
MPRVTQAHLDARLSDIGDAAYRVFARRGFAEATMQEIAAEAGVSAGTLYNYFDSKDAIIASVAGDVRDRRRAELDALDVGGDARNAFTRMGDAVFGPRLRDPAERYNFEMLVGLYAEAPRNPAIAKSLQATHAYVTERLIALWETSRDAGEIDAAFDPRALAQVMIALREGLLVQLVAGVDVDIDAYVNAMAALLRGELWRDGAKREAEEMQQ